MTERVLVLVEDSDYDYHATHGLFSMAASINLGHARIAFDAIYEEERYNSLASTEADINDIGNHNARGYNREGKLSTNESLSRMESIIKRRREHGIDSYGTTMNPNLDFLDYLKFTYPNDVVEVKYQKL